ncbi:MAG: cyclic nucleotide-binding domain-containing protein [Candidatus Hydrogenedentes bacterium]|nr:cyclic nucleotide-binding domain-containing protein [Candidatus Hydrogenedentota bacterium]
MKDGAYLLELLRKAESSESLTASSMNLIEDTLEQRSYKDGDLICEEGDSADWMFIVDKGAVAVLKKGEDDGQVEVSRLECGDFGGMMSLFEGTPRSARLEARGEAVLFVLHHNTLEKLLKKNHELGMGIMAFMSQCMRRDSEMLARLRTASLDKRFSMAVFDSKPYTEEIFKACNNERFSLQFFEHRLTAATAASALGFDAVCVFVNDDVSRDVVERLCGLGVKMIALRCAGFNNVDLEGCQQCGIDVVRVPAYSPNSVAEHAIALMMALNRRVHRAWSRVREGNFSLNNLVGMEMNGKTAGVIGMGRIGRCAAQILAGFGCNVLVCARHVDPEIAAMHGVTYADMEQILHESDILSLHLPLTPETHYMINREAIEKMKTGVMLINTSRGGLVDTMALIEGLKSGKIGSAGLDVYEEESNYFFEDRSHTIISDDVLARLISFNNVIITSHQAFLTHEALANIADTTFENIEEFVAGKHSAELTNIVLPK